MKKLSNFLCILLALSLALPAWAEDMPVIEWNRLTPTPAPTSKSHHVSILRSYAPGDTMTFGHYEQDADPTNGGEPIEWIVLETDGDTATLISRYGLDAKPYNTDREEVTWQTCSLRAWLNDDFLNEAFTPAEQQKLKTVTVANPSNPRHGTRGGSDTRDRVYLLSIGEAEAYFSSDDARMCAPTDAAIDHGASGDSDYRVDGRSAGSWWLRSPGYYEHEAAYVDRGGVVRSYGDDVRYDFFVVRPVVVLRLS